MAVWTVWEHPRWDDEEAAANARFVRDGFAWTAALFGPLWLLANGLWLLFLGFLVVFVAGAGLAMVTLGAPAANLVTALVSLWFGFEARGLKRWALARRGWRMTAVVDAKRPREAERRYFAHRDPLAVVERAPPPPAARPDAIVAPGEAGTDVLGVMPEPTR